MPPPIHILKKTITSKCQSQHLPLSTVQTQTFYTYRTNIISLFNTVYHIKLCLVILSFTWKLLYKTLHLHFHTQCPFYHRSLLNTLHLFSTYPILFTLLHHTNSLSDFLFPWHTKDKTRTALIALWAIWKLFNKETHESPLLNDARSKVLQSITSNELCKVKLAHSSQDVTPWALIKFKKISSFFFQKNSCANNCSCFL